MSANSHDINSEYGPLPTKINLRLWFIIIIMNYYKILGVVPYNDLMDLMKLSIAVINPSKSEGWSSTVEQAKSMGKMVLLSNLKVHKEQAPFRSFYFNPNKTKNLKKKIIQLHNNYSFIKERKNTLMAKKKMAKVKNEFVSKYINYIKKIKY